MINFKVKSIIYIVLGAFILISFSGFLLQIIGVAIGLFLIYKGFRLRNQYRTDFFCTKFMGQFFTHNSSNPFNRHR